MNSHKINSILTFYSIHVPNKVLEIQKEILIFRAWDPRDLGESPKKK